MEDIDVVKTLSKGKMIYKTHYREFYEFFRLSIIIFICLLGSYIFIQWHDYKHVLYIIMFALFATWLKFYTNSKCRILTKIESHFNNETIKNKIREFLAKYQYELKFNDSKHLRAMSKMNLTLIKNELTIILVDNIVFINIIGSTGLIRLPMANNKKELIKELKNLFNAGT